MPGCLRTPALPLTLPWLGGGAGEPAGVIPRLLR